MQLKPLTYWHTHSLPIHTKKQSEWLFAPGFLTDKLKLLGNYSLKLLSQHKQNADIHDSCSLDIALDSKIWIREVIMYINDKPCVLGRSIATIDDFTSMWHQLEKNIDTAIGHFLYSDVTIKRTPFECAQLSQDDPLTILARRYDTESPNFHARRSRFIKNDSILLVSECFLGDFWQIV